MKKIFITGVCLLASTLGGVSLSAQDGASVLHPDDFKCYIDRFNADDDELYRQYVSNDSAWGFLKANIPFFQCPDKDVETAYYYRWWTFRKHIKQTPTGFIISEFLPDVRWAGKYNSISCPAGHHFYEGRWLKDNRFLNKYADFWFTEGEPRRYSFWAANSLLEYYKVTSDPVVLSLLDSLVDNYEKWTPLEERRGHIVGLHDDGLYSMHCTFDGMEFSVGGSGKRPTINSYMYGDAVAIAEIARLKGNQKIREKYNKKADVLKKLVETRLWDGEASFFKTRSDKNDSLVDVRELQGYTPWYVNLPSDNAGFAKAWSFLLSNDGFRAPYGMTTTEQSHPGFQLPAKKPCTWNGRVWPFSTAVTLTAMANLLNNYHQDIVSDRDYFSEFLKYSRSQKLVTDDGKVVSWIDESQNPYTGEWMTRNAIKRRAAEGKAEFNERGKHYNHSTYCDLVISGLVGIRPQIGNSVVINPLVPDNTWDWFCLDNVYYKGHVLTVVYDRYGEKYNLGKGFMVFVDRQLKSHTKKMKKVSLDL